VAPAAGNVDAVGAVGVVSVARVVARTVVVAASVALAREKAGWTAHATPTAVVKAGGHELSYSACKNRKNWFQFRYQ
jgi:hypothetical protein